jgi:hypothetical protein
MAIAAIFDDLDVCSGGIVAAVILSVGFKLTERRPDVRNKAVTFGFVAFLAIFILILRQDADATEYAASAIQAGVAAAGVTGVACIAFPLLRFLFNVFVDAPRKRLAKMAGERHEETARRNAKRESDVRARQAEDERKRADEEYARTAPDRALKEQAALDDQSRRERARSSCELTYRLYGPEIRDRFTKKMLDEYIAKYMNDRVSAQEVEDQARRVIDMMQHHKEHITPSQNFKTLEDVARWYSDQKEQIEQSVDDDDLKQTLLGELRERYTDLSMAFLHRAQP